MIDISGWNDDGGQHRSLIPFLVLKYGWKTGAELGLGSGYLFHRLLLECPELRLIGVDLMERPDRAANVRHIAGIYPGRTILYPYSTHVAAGSVGNRSLDFVFIDAGHSFAAVREDIRDWKQKVRPGGYLLGHDFHPKFPGVIRAVKDAFTEFEQLPCWVWAVQL